MLLTFLVYQILREARDATRNRDVDMFFRMLALKGLAMIFVWPFVVFRLGTHLQTTRAHVIWYSFFLTLMLASLVTATYIAIGLVITFIAAGFVSYELSKSSS